MGTHANEPARPQDLVNEHLDLVGHAVTRVAARFPRHVDRDELWNAGALGLVDAARRYDPTLGIPFPRYAAVRIRGAIIDATRNRDWASRSSRRRMRELQQATDDLRGRHGRDPDPQELASALGIGVDEIAAIEGAARASALLHLDQPVGVPDAEMTLGDLVRESTVDHLPDEQLEQRELIGTLRVAVRCLPPVQREVIERYYTRGELLREIAEHLGVTEARISQIRTEALQAMRAYFHTSFDGVPAVAADTPGRRSRDSFLESMERDSSWRSCLAAADEPMGVAASA